MCLINLAELQETISYVCLLERKLSRGPGQASGTGYYIYFIDRLLWLGQQS